MTKSIEWLAEDYILQLLAKNPALSGKPMRHHDDNRKGEDDCIDVEAAQQDHELEGPRGYKVNVTIEYRSPLTSTKDQNDSVIRCVRFSLETAASVSVDAVSNFNDLLLFTEEITGDRTSTEHLRKRSLTIPLLFTVKNL